MLYVHIRAVGGLRAASLLSDRSREKPRGCKRLRRLFGTPCPARIPSAEGYYVTGVMQFAQHYCCRCKDPGDGKGAKEMQELTREEDGGRATILSKSDRRVRPTGNAAATGRDVLLLFSLLSLRLRPKPDKSVLFCWGESLAFGIR